MNTAQETAVSIIETHYNEAWKQRLIAQHSASRGRYTKEKERQREIAEAKEQALRGVVNELREAGYTITEQ